jgi:hypothetical protein
MININENSPEYMAYRLFQDIVHVENKILHASQNEPNRVANRAWILQTYSECLKCMREPQAFVRDEKSATPALTNCESMLSAGEQLTLQIRDVLVLTSRAGVVCARDDHSLEAT